MKRKVLVWRERHSSYSVHAPFTAGGGIFGGTPDSGAGAPADPGFSPSGAEGTSGCIMVPALSSAGATRRLRAGFQQHLSTQQRPLLVTRPKRSAQTHLVRVRITLGLWLVLGLGLGRFRVRV